MKKMVHYITNEIITITKEKDYEFTYKTDNSTRVLVKTIDEAYEYLEFQGYELVK